MKYLFLYCVIFSYLNVITMGPEKSKIDFEGFFTSPFPEQHLDNTQDPENTQTKATHSETFYCDQCTQEVTAFDKKMHFECDHHQCFDCGAQFKSSTEVMNHNLDKHVNPEQLKPHSIKSIPTDPDILRYKKRQYNSDDKIRIKLKKSALKRFPKK